MFPWQKTRVLLTALALAVVAGCASERPAHDGAKASQQRNWDAAVYHYLEALAKEPDNQQYRMALIRARQKASQEHFHRGVTLRDLGRLVAARNEFEMTVQLDPTNQRAEQELNKVVSELAILAEPGGKETLAEIKRRAREAKVQPPVLNPRSDEPITLSFPQAKPVKEIYRAIGKAYGFNVTFDSKLKDDKLAIELNDVTAERALELVMQAAGHFYKVLDEHSIIIAEDTPQNRREYEDLVIKTFFLSNADVKDVDKLLRSLIEARRLATNEQLNSITLRDTADKVAIAEKLINISDKAKAEVLVDVELLQIDSNKTKNIGVNLIDALQNLYLDLDKVVDSDSRPPSSTPSLYLDQFDLISRDAMYLNVPTVLLNLMKSSGETQTLAQPQLRITEGEKASLVIGDRVPIPVTAFNTANQTGAGVVPITSFQYQDVGIKIEVEPRVHHNEEVTLKLNVEVSQLGDEMDVGPNQKARKIGTRSITSVIRLKSGETSLLAGLFKSDRTKSSSKTPLLGDIPILGRLFREEGTTELTTDLILTLTPHVVRFPDIKEEDLAPVWVGTESRVTFNGNRPKVESGRSPVGPFDSPQGNIDSGRSSQRPIPHIRQLPKAGAASRIPSRSQSPSTPRGINLVPPVNTSESADHAESLQKDAGGGDLAAGPPMVLSLQPSVLSFPAGDEKTLQLVAAGAGPCELPVDLSFDPQRLSLLNVDAAPGVVILEEHYEPDSGWLGLVIRVDQGDTLGMPLATLSVRAVDPGPGTVMVTSDGATSQDGSTIQVASDGAEIFVQGIPDETFDEKEDLP